MSRGILALDQGTTSTRAILFDEELRPLAVAQRELPQSFPHPGRVEHDPDRIHHDAITVLRDCVSQGRERGVRDFLALGITNQRETIVLWERASGRPLHPAIVWQDRRTAEHCARLRAEGAEELIRARTGLLLDPYFSATKLAWLLSEVPSARAAAERGELCAGTIDSFLLWRASGGAVHATDASNAARTLLFDIHRQCWDPELLALFGVPEGLLPEVRDNASHFADLPKELLGVAIPVRGMAGDQQAAAFGQACLEPGMAKSTYGTGCFLLMNTGERVRESGNGLLSTVAWRLDDRTTYALEGSSFSAGATLQWLRDGLGLFEDPRESAALAAAADPEQRVHLVPAFNGLGAPWWDPEARGALLGLTRATGRAEIVRAALEASAFRTRDLLEAMGGATPGLPPLLRVDGGLATNDWAMQFLADLLGCVVERPAVTETTALGAAALAGLGVGLYASAREAASHWRLERRFHPRLDPEERERRYREWLEALARTCSPGHGPAPSASTIR